MKSRRGISLIEVMVAVTLLGMIVTVHTMVTLQFAYRNRVAAAGVNRAAAMSAAVDLFTTMPFSSLAANDGCTDIAVPAQYPHERCVTITSLSATTVRIQIVITPDNAALTADTRQLDRSAPMGSGPFL